MLPTNKPLTDAEWQVIQRHFPNEEASRGKPHAPWRAVVNSILYVLQGNKWQTIPSAPIYATKSVSHRYYNSWGKEKISAVLKDLGIAEAVFPPSRSRIKAVATKALTLNHKQLNIR